MNRTIRVMAAGLWYTTKGKPSLNRTAAGIFSMQLHVVDRIGKHNTESWQLLWVGPEAEAFNRAHGAALCIPGQPLRAQVYGIQAFASGRWRSGEIHAHIHSCELAPRAAHADLQPQPATV